MGLAGWLRCETLIGHVKLLFCAMDYAKSLSTFLFKATRKVRVGELVGCDVMSAQDNENLAFDLAALGYPGLSYLRPKLHEGSCGSPIFSLAR